MDHQKCLRETPVIVGTNITLRRGNINDAQGVFEYGSDPLFTEFLPFPPHKDIEESRQILRSFFIDNPESYIIINSLTKAMVGTIDLRVDKANNKGEFGYAIIRKYWNKGYAAEALSLIIALGFEKLKLNRLEAECAVGNIGSRRVMEKCGLVLEGTSRQSALWKGTYFDLQHFAILNPDNQH